MGICIALAGNPNSGKTTLFNHLTASSQYVGNWPGVTVEKKSGRLKNRPDVSVVDLPGIYSLSPYTPEEVVSRDFLLSGEAQAILNLVDATNIERNLFLTTQLLELGLPVVVALNMADLLAKNGDVVDADALAQSLGCPVISISALKQQGTAQAAEAAVQAAQSGPAAVAKPLPLTPVIEEALAGMAAQIGEGVPPNKLRWTLIKALERDEAAIQSLNLAPEQRRCAEALSAGLETVLDDDAEGIITTARYERVDAMVTASIQKKARSATHSNKIDNLVTNRWLALPIFAAMMVAMYYVSIVLVGNVVTGWLTEDFFAGLIGTNLAAWLQGLGAAAWAVSLVTDGIVGGVGAVLGFVPQMAVLFLFLCFLEDVGYMARVAFIMDRIFRKFGLSGKSFIPILISSGCGVPGILATQTIENESDRRMTAMTATFIPCGAKLPVIALIGGAVLGGSWWVATAIYFAGVASIILTGAMLKKTRLFAGEATPFVMELPAYHLPSAKNLALHVWNRVREYLVKAGTVIFLASVVLWFLLSFGIQGGRFGVAGVENSFLARIGGVLAPLFAPLGFGSWDAAMAVLAGFVGKENLVSALSITANLAGSAGGGAAPLFAYAQAMLPGTAAGLSFLLFNMLNAPCFAAIAALHRQMRGGQWTAFAIGYQCVYAYAVSLMVYQFGSWFAGGAFTAGTGFAVAVLALLLLMLLRPARKAPST